ncbi:MAG TPA: response regulator [Candidatus Dormibacteraeota bacterium]|jgi:DNA-binding response OmpR family regulator|nr:response regulator [Candidatus Dormibacteraeota bacterium]
MSATVLVVEDEPMIGRILEHKLSREGHRVLWAHSAAEAESVARSTRIDLALVDVTLERDGVDLAAGWTDAAAPVHGWLAMVEARHPEHAVRARAAGASGAVVKPFKPTAVAAQVRGLLDAEAR